MPLKNFRKASAESTWEKEYKRERERISEVYLRISMRATQHISLLFVAVTTLSVGILVHQTVHAFTQEELQAQIQALLSQVAALQVQLQAQTHLLTLGFY